MSMRPSRLRIAMLLGVVGLCASAGASDARNASRQNIMIERMLAMALCNPGRQDGVFDAQTAKALQCLQKRINDRQTGALSAALREDMLDVWREKIANQRRRPSMGRRSSGKRESR